VGLGNIYFYQKKYDISFSEFEKALSLDPDFLEATEMMGDFHLIREKLDVVENYFSAMIESENPIARFYGKLWLFSLRIAQGRYGDGKIAILAAIKEADKDQIKSDKLAFLILLAYVNHRMGHFDEALEASEQAELIATELKFHHDKMIALRLQGLTHVGMNNIEEAEKISTNLKNYLDSIKIPKYMRYYYHLAGIVTLHNDKNSMAEENFATAFSLLSFQHEALDDHAIYLYSQAIAYDKTNELDQALEQFKKITELTSGRIQFGDIYAKSYYWLGKIYQRQGQKQKAQDNFEKFLELWKEADPTIQEIKDAKKFLRQLNETKSGHPITRQN
jgi:tetratricopeptide (TPR) repeat protein